MLTPDSKSAAKWPTKIECLAHIRLGSSFYFLASLQMRLAGPACNRIDAAPKKGPRNVLLVSIDTLRADHIGDYGAPDARTSGKRKDRPARHSAPTSEYGRAPDSQRDHMHAATALIRLGRLEEARAHLARSGDVIQQPKARKVLVANNRDSGHDELARQLLDTASQGS